MPLYSTIQIHTFRVYDMPELEQSELLREIYRSFVGKWLVAAYGHLPRGMGRTNVLCVVDDFGDLVVVS